jgi:leader peptidase (prepilin peptidase)/N-methyltransferase
LNSRTSFEFAVATIVAIAAAAASVVVMPNPRGTLGAGLALVMIAIAVIDARHFIIPDALNATALLLGLVHAALDPWQTLLESLGMALLRGVVLAACFFALRAVYFRIRGREGIGLGDVKLAGVAGVWLDWATIPIAIEIAALAALAVYLLMQLVRRRPLAVLARLPFGLFLAPAIWLGWIIEAAWLAP